MGSERKIWVIGDIHGHSLMLDKLLGKMKVKWGTDLLVITGDMIDRGPNSSEVIYKLRTIQKFYPHTTIVLKGNHEDLCINAYTKNSYDDLYLWYMNGGKITEESFTEEKVPDEIIKWFYSLPLYYETENFFFSHAPIPRETFRDTLLRGKPYSKDEYIWTYSRDEFGVAKTHKNKIGVCGHIHALCKGDLGPRFYPHYIYVDTGCGCHTNAPLTAIEVQSKKVIQVYPKEVYKPSKKKTR